MAENKKINVPAVLRDTFGEDVQLLGTGYSEKAQTARISRANPETGQPEELNIDLDAVLTDVGFEHPMLMEKVYNTPEQPFKDNALTFTERMAMNAASTPKQQGQYLAKTYGEDNVKPDPEDKDSFVVKKDGAWMKASGSFGADLLTDSPTIAASIAGAIGGAKLGALAGPAGVLTGAVVGAGLATAVAKLGEIKTAEVLGVRTEEDGKTLGAEIGKEALQSMIWDTALLGAGKLAKNTIGRIANKESVARVFSRLYENVPIEDWMKTMQSSEVAKTVKDGIDSEIKWANKKLVGGFEATGEALSPATKRMNQAMQIAVDEFKRSASTTFDRGLKTLNDSGAFDAAKISAKDIYDSYGKNLVEMGVATATEKGYVLKSGKEMASGIDKVGSPAAVRQLQSMFKKLDNVIQTGNGNFNNFQHFKDIKDSIVAIERSANIFGNPNYNSTVVKTMKQLGTELTNTAQKQVNATGKFVIDQGKKIPAGDYLADLNRNYYKFKHYNDEIGDLISQAGSDQDLLKFAENLASSKKLNLAQGFIEMGNASGSSNAPKILDQLARLKAIKNISSIYTKKGLVTSSLEMARMGSNVAGKAAATGAQAVGSVKNGANVVSKYTGLAHMTDFIKKLDPTDKANILTNQKMLDQLLSSIDLYSDIKNNTVNSLMQSTQQQPQQQAPNGSGQ